MGKITVYTKQHKSVLEKLMANGRYVAEKKIVHGHEDAFLMINAYDWLVAHHPDRERKPEDADYPVWVSFEKADTMIPGPDTVMLELEVEEDLITRLNVIKWTAINNCQYIAKDEKDAKLHRQKMEDYGLDDVKVCTTRFYPELRKEIEDSWLRAFDDTVDAGNDHAYGLLWEVKKEWIKRVIG